MKTAVAISLWLTVFALGGCKTNKASTPTDTTVVNTSDGEEPNGAPTVGIAINIDGTLWHAETYGIHQMGTFWIVKGTATDGSVFSVMLPDPLATGEYPVSQGGQVSITYSTDRAKGYVFFAPFSENNGWVKTTLKDGYLRGSLEVTITNSGINRLCTGTFSIKL